MRGHTTLHDVWQRNYREHVIRNEPYMNRIRETMCNNPAQWELDGLFSGNAANTGVSSLSLTAGTVREPPQRNE